MEFAWFDFALASIVMSLGIGADVAIATAMRANQLNTIKAIVFWVVGVSATHTLFPMLGYLLTYFSIQTLPVITPLVGLLAFVCIFYYLKSEWQAGGEAEHPESTRLMVTFGLILAVSWDALWSGPAKSAQVIGWPETLVWLSFLIVGILVSLLAVGGLLSAKAIGQKLSEKPLIEMSAQWVQHSVIGYFGLLALFRYTLEIEFHWSALLVISFSLTAIMLGLKKYKSSHSGMSRI